MRSSHLPTHRLGRIGLDILAGTGRMGILLVQIVRPGPTTPHGLARLLHQLRFVGSRSMLVINVAALFVGMVLALQFHDTLVRFGSITLLGSAVGLSLVRELAPVLTALIVIGRAGSAVCAEMAIMRTDSQIDALECMAIDARRYLLWPRFMAFLIAVPLLTAMFDVVGIIGGYCVATANFDLGAATYFTGITENMTGHDLHMGIVKSACFGALSAWICLGHGFLIHRGPLAYSGPEGVSQTTTSAVVTSSLVVLFADYILSSLML
jgi:phospholipid/cholesterol/gamma-HCH transport system permease protein